ncbi:MAG: FAD:protein FMN transferase, partial [Bacteroidota bacterium]|nr:FAD:protein FMN transferase [Bacteroidota bacterium]
RNFQDSIDVILKKFDSSCSIYKPNSIISRFNNNDPTVKADKDFTTVFNKAMEVSEKSGGAFDLTVGQLVRAWGFSIKGKMKMDAKRVDSLKQYVGYQKIKLVNGKVIKKNPNIQLDFNAIAQGYSSDVLARFLESKGIKNYLIDVGGEVLGRGQKPDGSKWSVGIEKPAKDSLQKQQLEAVVTLDNRALSTSGNYRKYFIRNGVKYSHTIDPFTGYPVHHTLLAVSVLAENSITADAYGTVFLVMGMDKALDFIKRNPGLEAYFIYSDEKGNLKTNCSPGFRKIIKEQL